MQCKRCGADLAGAERCCPKCGWVYEKKGGRGTDGFLCLLLLLTGTAVMAAVRYIL